MSATPTDDGRRAATVARTTSETDITIELDLDGGNRVETSTGIPFFDHMLAQLGRHGGFDLVVRATGDLEIDAHHTVEDVGIALGEVFKVAAETMKSAQIPEWVSSDPATLSGTVLAEPAREQMPLEFNEQLVVEYYSR